MPDYDPVSNIKLDSIPRTMTWRVSELTAGSSIESHQHQRAQLLYASAGVMTVTTETGLSFSQWRQQARLLEAMRLLADGVAVTTVAMELGYGNQSALVPTR